AKCAVQDASRNKITLLRGSCRDPPARYQCAVANPGGTSTERLLARPGVRRVPSSKVELFTIPGFLPGELCDALMALIDANRRPSTIADPNGDHYFRTSETCHLDHG